MDGVREKETGGEESKTVSVRFFSILYIYILLFLLSGHSLVLGDFIFSMCVKKNIACIWIFEGASV